MCSLVVTPNVWNKGVWVRVLALHYFLHGVVARRVKSWYHQERIIVILSNTVLFTSTFRNFRPSS
jgi:hypothetical protein